jgi:hypothetical protein
VEKFGIRRDGSYYSRVQWTDCTLDNPLFWVCNLIDDDTERTGGTWGANSSKPVNAVLDFFGEEQEIGKIRIFQNVGLPISKLEELVSELNLYISNDDRCKRLGDKEADVNQIDWKKVLSAYPGMKEGWYEFSLAAIQKAKYIRLEMVKNFGDNPQALPWIETSELKVYPSNKN